MEIHGIDTSLVTGKGNTQEEKLATRKFIAATIQKFDGKDLPHITCTCGKYLRIDRSYRCRMCGIWLCSTCADDHFDFYVTRVGEIKQLSLFKRFKKRCREWYDNYFGVW